MTTPTENPYIGIAPGARMSLQNLGHQGGNLVIDHTDVPKENADDGLVVAPLDRVFSQPNKVVALVFGNPNVSLILPSLDPMAKDPEQLAASMVWRSPTFWKNTKGRVQAGVYMELRGLGDDAISALREAGNSLVGTRKASCAHSMALALHRAGFRLRTGGSLRWMFRPTHLAAALWNNQLYYKYERVTVRWITTDKTVHEHFLAAWKREYLTACRLAKKLMDKGGHTPAPVFDPNDESHDMTSKWPTDAPVSMVSISRPSRLGVNLGYALGEQPEFSLSIREGLRSEVLQQPLKAFDGRLDRITRLKRFILFNELVVWLMRGNLVRSETRRHLPIPVIVDMLRKSPTNERDERYAYNFVLLPHAIRIKRLLNNTGRDHKVVSWLLAKHVLLSGWSKKVMLAGELWVSKVDGVVTIYLSGNSGTYKPTSQQVIAAAKELSQAFNVPVVPVLRAE